MKKRIILLVSVLLVSGAGFVRYNNTRESSAKDFTDSSGRIINGRGQRIISPNTPLPPSRIEAEKPEIREIQDDSAVEIVEKYGDIYVKEDKTPRKKNTIKRIKTLQSLKKTKDKSGKRK